MTAVSPSVIRREKSLISNDLSSFFLVHSVDGLIARGQRVLQIGEEGEEERKIRNLDHERRKEEIRLEFEDRVALGKNDVNMDLDQRITHLRQKFAAIEKSMRPRLN